MVLQERQLPQRVGRTPRDACAVYLRSSAVHPPLLEQTPQLPNPANDERVSVRVSMNTDVTPHVPSLRDKQRRGGGGVVI